MNFSNPSNLVLTFFCGISFIQRQKNALIVHVIMLNLIFIPKVPKVFNVVVTSTGDYSKHMRA